MKRHALCLSLFALAATAAQAKPNVLLIIADDMGLEASNCYDLGDQQAPMPNLQALCQSGMVFENAYAAPTCSPTRATIMSGQYGFRTGVGAPVAPDGSDALSPDTYTLFDALAPTGYASNLIGKWHISGRRNGYEAPTDMGVPDYFGLYSGGLRDYFNWTAIEDGEETRIDGYATTVLADRAIDWITEQSQPWFLWLAFNAPHAPFHQPPKDLHSYDDLPNTQADIRRNPLPYYQAMLEALDTEIGRLLDSIPQYVRDNTIVIFLGDNGSPNQVTRGFYGNHQAKGTIYDSGTHVPLILSGPEVSAGRSEAFVNTTDLTTTIASLTGATFSSPDSIDFSAALTGGDTARDVIYVEHFTDRETKGRGVYGWALREGDFKLVQPDGQSPQLFNLADDPLEQINLLANGGTQAHQTTAKRLLAQQTALTNEAR